MPPTEAEAGGDSGPAVPRRDTTGHCTGAVLVRVPVGVVTRVKVQAQWSVQRHLDGDTAPRSLIRAETRLWNGTRPSAMIVDGDVSEGDPIAGPLCARTAYSV